MPVSRKIWLALAVLALAVPAARAEAAPVPLIVDTDMFSDADDVGALATAFALQVEREATVIAINVNTRPSRPAVARNSWRCAATISAFYSPLSVPIGAAMPDNGSSAGDAGFATPCAALAASSTPAPDDAVDVYRRALAAQGDGSVVVASVGYLSTLSSLLDSAPDAISALSGAELIAAKVKRLVVMGGGYPSRAGETNLGGDPPAARNVADNWPTKIVWSGFEVGDAVHTGDTISSVHPSDSPVRVAYEAFAGRDTAIDSFDLTAVYHAVRPGDAAMHEVGPGTNSISNTGANTFTTGAGNQYYLVLDSAASLEHSIEALLDTLPSDAPPEPPTPSPPAAVESSASPPPPPAPAPAPAAPPVAAPAVARTDPFVFVRLGVLRIKTPASWIRRRGRYETTLASGCRVTVIVKPRAVATRMAAARQVRAGTGDPPRFGSGRRAGGAWAVGYKPAHVVRGRASIRVAARRYVQVVADGILGAGCSDADAATLAQPIRTLVRTAGYAPRRKSSSSRL